MELQGVVYDGWSLRGRLLVSPRDGNIRIDKRFIESIALSTTDIVDCATGRPVEFMVLDVLARPPQAEDVLMLAPGHWYGKDIRIPLGVEAPNRARGPECIRADFVFHTFGDATALLHVRATTAPPTSGESSPGADP